MAEVERYIFDYQEVVTALVKQQGIHEGIWALYLEFGIAAANIQLTGDQRPPTPGHPPTDVTPTALIPVQKIGIVRSDYVSKIAVDASLVNPKPGAAKGDK